MGRPYSLDLREKVIAAVETGGLSCRQAAAQFGVGVSSAIRWVERVRKTGTKRASNKKPVLPQADVEDES